jgi:ADP-ribosyl-[dinitrogen reductase] hydrolase
MDRPFENSYWVLPGIVLAGEYPAGATEAATSERLQRLLDAGIDLIIDLTEAGERPQYHSLLPASVDYLRCAIPDASVPADPAHMRTIQAHLQTAVAVGRHVYVHCFAGVGRTATVIGCYLVEQGVDGPAALSQLNHLWKSCGRAVTWPVVPQTRQQAEFIRRWSGQRQPLAPPPGLSALRALRARYLGSLLGLAVGDALGASTQYRRVGSFAPLGDLVGGGPFDLPRGSWSDDTAMALCLAESLLESQGCEPHDQLLRYTRWQRHGHLAAGSHCVGITAGTARALGRGAPALTGGNGANAAVDPPSQEAAPLSRVAPVVLFYFAHEAQAILQAEACARLFDAAPLLLDSCRLLAAMLHAALRGEPLSRVLQPPLTLFAPRPLAPPVAALLARDPALPPGGYAGPALTVLNAARWALASGGGFREGALRAANFGGDSDVIGAIHGQLAGALYGAQAIPAGWLGALARRAEIDEMADRLLAAALVRLAENPA